MDKWIGKKQQTTDRLTSEMVKRYSVTVHDQKKVDAGLLYGLHYCLGNEALPSGQLGADSHPAKGEFMPPIDLPRRMWAGSRVDFHAPLPMDRDIVKTSTISKIEPKQSSSGKLVFVTVDHLYEYDGDVLIEETQTIVYRDEVPYKRALAEQLPHHVHMKTVVPNATRLFRYSAITFNGHRIHYDSDYARDVEGYPGLVVHGPLIATWLMNFSQDKRPDKRLKSFEFRGNAPAFVGETLALLVLDGECTVLEARNHDGALIQTAKAKFEE